MKVGALRLPLPAASVNAPASTSIVWEASSEGVRVAVYTVELSAVKLLIVPADTEISEAEKLLVASLAVKVRLIDESLLISPLTIVEDDILNVGAV